MSPATFLGKCSRNVATWVLSAATFIVFLFLDFLDAVMCVVYRILDSVLEGKASSCYCLKNKEDQQHEGQWNKSKETGDDGESEVSETLFGRRNAFREMGMVGLIGLVDKWWGVMRLKKRGSVSEIVSRWSDCGCESCSSWTSGGGGRDRLHVVVKEPSRETFQEKETTENVIFIHGFLSSSSVWTKTVFPNISETAMTDHRLFAIDLLGFGKSPKPGDCLYTISDHVEAIQKSVIDRFQLNSLHLVAHSMGCIIALALGAKYSKCVKSITLIAPPYFPSLKADASFTALERLAEKKLWPPSLFGSSLMSWYEHLGRCVCFIICRHHQKWERILKLLTRKRDLHFMVVDLTRHTHHSAWHTMHNVICGGAKLVDGYLEALRLANVKISIFHGDKDQVVPLQCSYNIKTRIPDAEINVIPNADHNDVILGRECVLTQHLERIWRLSSILKRHRVSASYAD